VEAHCEVEPKNGLFGGKWPPFFTIMMSVTALFSGLAMIGSRSALGFNCGHVMVGEKSPYLVH
jgi:hypothetical protein